MCEMASYLTSLRNKTQDLFGTKTENKFALVSNILFGYNWR